MVRTCGKNNRRTTVKKVLKNNPEGKKHIGKPGKRRLDDVKKIM